MYTMVFSEVIGAHGGCFGGSVCSVSRGSDGSLWFFCGFRMRKF